jgi:sterol desaturase/sphingolipid hydroxylase (fatty acid hydroxylase superfamily)
MTLPLHAATTGVIAGSGLLLWLAEGGIPFFRERISRSSHAAANLGLGALNLIVLLPSGIATAAILGSSGAYFKGVASFVTGTIPRSLFILLMLDLWMYLWHRLNHEFPLLWRLHSVHHSDWQLDVTSSWRFHPGEILLSELFRLPFLVLLGVGVQDLILYNLLMTPVIQLHHSNIRLPEPLDRLLRIIIPTPLLHRIHHSPSRTEHNANYGAMLSLWDRLSGTLTVRPVTPASPVGLEGENSPTRQRISSLITSPLRNL